MIEGPTPEAEKSVLEEALFNISESERKILDSVIKNDAVYLKNTKNLNPTPTKVAQLPDASSQGFLLIYNQLEELLGEKTSAEKTSTGTVPSGLGKVFDSLGIGLQSMGAGFQLLGEGLAAMGKPAVFVGIGAASLILVAIAGFIAGLSALENAGLGPSVVISNLLHALTDSLIYLISGLANILSENSDLIEMLLQKFIDALQQLPPIMHELGPIIEAVMPGIVQGLESFGRVIESLIENLDDIIDAFGDFIVKVIKGTFTAVTEAVERLAEVNASNLFAVSGALAAVSASIVLFGAGNIVGALGTFLGGDGLITKLTLLADLGPRLSLSGTGIRELAKGVSELGKVSISSNFFLRSTEVDRIIDFVNAFDRNDFKRSLASLKSTLPLFEAFSSSLSNMASGILSLANLEDQKYNKALQRVKEIVSLSKEVGANFASISGTFANVPVTEVQDAVFTLEHSANSGTYFQTQDGLIKTNPLDNLTVVASTNQAEDTSVREMTEVLASKFDSLFKKLDDYVEAIVNKEPDVAILPSMTEGSRMPLDELLKVGV